MQQQPPGGGPCPRSSRMPSSLSAHLLLFSLLLGVASAFHFPSHQHQQQRRGNTAGSPSSLGVVVVSRDGVGGGRGGAVVGRGDRAPPSPISSRYATKRGRRWLTMKMERDPGDHHDDMVREERPKAMKQKAASQQQPLVAAATRERGGGKAEEETWEENLGRTLVMIVDGVKEHLSAPIENYALLLGDICVLLGFRLMMDIMLSPVPSLDIDATPAVIEKGLSLYAEPAIAVSHVVRTLVDGTALGLFWMMSAVMGRNEVMEMKATLDHRTSALLTFKNWMTASNLRLIILLMQAVYLEQHIDLSLVQLELVGTLTIMLAWRALYTAVMRLFLH